jgi:hypothetical protein
MQNRQRGYTEPQMPQQAMVISSKCISLNL